MDSEDACTATNLVKASSSSSLQDTNNDLATTEVSQDNTKECHENENEEEEKEEIVSVPVNNDNENDTDNTQTPSGETTNTTATTFETSTLTTTPPTNDEIKCKKCFF